MHDGYLFTLGICGTAAATTSAPDLLNAMLGALPPVKRAALLGEVLHLDSNNNLYDPLLDAIVSDLRDAEVVLLISPLYYRAGYGRSVTALPARLTALFERCASLATTGQLHGTIVVLVGVISSLQSPLLEREQHRELLDPLHRFCVGAGMTIAGQTVVYDHADALPLPETLHTVRALAQHAYAQARQRCPDALPR